MGARTQYIPLISGATTLRVNQVMGRMVGHVKNAMDVRSGGGAGAAGDKPGDSDSSSAFFSSFFMVGCLKPYISPDLLNS